MIISASDFRRRWALSASIACRLFTSSAYTCRRAPFAAARKITAVMTRAGLAATSHDGKAPGAYPRYLSARRLFQISETNCSRPRWAILAAGRAAQVSCSSASDRFDRLRLGLLFAPRERISPEVRERIHAISPRLPWPTSASTRRSDDSPLMRIHYIIGRNAGTRPRVISALLRA